MVTHLSKSNQTKLEFSIWNKLGECYRTHNAEMAFDVKDMMVKYKALLNLPNPLQIYGSGIGLQNAVLF